MNKLFVYLFVSIFLISLVSSATSYIGETKQGECIILPQTNPVATFSNISQITHVRSATQFLSEDVSMSSNGTYRWIYEFCDTLLIGDYAVDGYGDDPDKSTWSYAFKVTSTGFSGAENIVFILFIIVVIYGINLLGFFGKNETMTLLGGMFLMFLGIYIINNGMIIYRDDLTNYFAYITIGWGFVSSIMAGISLMND
jgi:amino acid transporter